jgi:hypothetical protein
MKTHLCDILIMTAEAAWENIEEAVARARKFPAGYHRNHWLEIAKRSTDVWLERTENKVQRLELRLFVDANPLDHTAKGKVR